MQNNEDNNLIQYSLVSLLDSKVISDIRIPVIQRDFAFGRIEESDKRDSLLSKLYYHLEQNQPIPYILDFVYGKVDADKNFYPIDGQQRLTTLYLLHLYLAKKDKTKEDFSKLTYLKKFHYESRKNSEDFCDYLYTEELNFSSDNLLKQIENCAWFRNNWKNDATVSAMLIMLQAIHEKFRNTTNFYEKLTINVNKTISFYFLDLGKKEFELTDELYIKMNARGKQLTKFENYKASFIDFLDNTFPSQKNTFTHKIESDWTDLFWGYRIDEEHFDERMLNFFDFFSSLSFFKNHPDAKLDDYELNNIKQNFLLEEDITLLYNSLNWLYSISKKNANKEILARNQNGEFEGQIEVFLKDIFSKNRCKLFWDQEANIFVDILENNSEVQSQILFYELLRYVTEHNITTTTEELYNYLRLIRNLLAATLQLNEVTFNTNVRLNYFGNYHKLFNQLNGTYDKLLQKEFDLSNTRITKENFDNEIEKVQLITEKKIESSIIYELENLSLFEGILFNLKLNQYYAKAPQYLKAIKEIWYSDLKNRYINMALIASGFNGLYIRDCCNGCWGTFFFGSKSNWKTILIYNKNQEKAEAIRDSIHTLLETFISTKGDSTEDKINSIIEANLSNFSYGNWHYYFLKYPDIFAMPGYMNYFAWDWAEKNFGIESLKYASSNPTSGKHLNPYVFLVALKINNEDICKIESCKIQHGYTSSLVLKDGKEIFCMEDGWHIRKESLSKIELIKKYSMIEKDNEYCFKETQDMDRVEVCYKFVKDLYSKN